MSTLRPSNAFREIDAVLRSRCAGRRDDPPSFVVGGGHRPVRHQPRRQGTFEESCPLTKARPNHVGRGQSNGRRRNMRRGLPTSAHAPRPSAALVRPLVGAGRAGISLFNLNQPGGPSR